MLLIMKMLTFSLAIYNCGVKNKKV